MSRWGTTLGALSALVAVGCTASTSAETETADADLISQGLGSSLQWACVADANLKVRPQDLTWIVKAGGYAGRCRIYGDRRQLGDGEATTYVTFPEAAQEGRPDTIGVQLSKAALENLPTEHNDGATCWDVNGDGELDDEEECENGTQRNLDFPRAAKRVSPFKFIGVNWEPYGHHPPGVYDVPHFDLHFNIQSERDENFIRPGPCGELVNCEDEVTANKPLPPQFLPTGYVNAGLVVPRMGNHLLNLARAPEFEHGSAAFTSTLLYGMYNAHLTFIEPMIKSAWLLTRPNVCFDLDQPQAFELAGFYPQRYCVNYSSQREEYTIALTSFAYHAANH